MEWRSSKRNSNWCRMVAHPPARRSDLRPCRPIVHRSVHSPRYRVRCCGPTCYRREVVAVGRDQRSEKEHRPAADVCSHRNPFGYTAAITEQPQRLDPPIPGSNSCLHHRYVAAATTALERAETDGICDKVHGAEVADTDGDKVWP